MKPYFAKLLASFIGLGLVFGLVASEVQAVMPKASTILSKLAIKGRAPQTGYDRELFSDGWARLEAVMFETTFWREI